MSPDPCAQPVLWVPVFHTMVMGGGQGTPPGRGDVPSDGRVGLVAKCSAVPCPALGGGVILTTLAVTPLGFGAWRQPGQWGPAGAAQPLAQGQAQNKPRLSGRAGHPGQKISLPSPWHLLTASGWPVLQPD